MWENEKPKIQTETKGAIRRQLEARVALTPVASLHVHTLPVGAQPSVLCTLVDICQNISIQAKHSVVALLESFVLKHKNPSCSRNNMKTALG